MKRLSLLLTLLIATLFPIFAQTIQKVDETLAFRMAQTFANTQLTLKSQDLDLVYSHDIYIYNIGNQGFVIISSNTVLPPVLGWSDQGNFPDLENAPENFSSWLRHYGEMIDYAIANDVRPEAAIQRQWDEATQGIFGTRDTQTVDPLISTRWNQDCFYNENCPSTGGGWWGGGPCGHAYAGCVACAMAQIMKYWNRPTQGFGSHSYIHGDYGQQSANFANTTYQWNQMPDEIWNSNNAIATLMYHCGVSVNMNYGPNGSGAYSPDVETALRSYFGYCGAKYVAKNSFQEENWIAMLKSELNLSRPIYYSGAHESSGHAFVCDGYDSNDLMHFNFGWSGSGDGYYSTYDINGYNEGQAIVTHIYPIEIQADANGIIYVSPDGTGDGSSWANATNKLEIAAAMSKSTGAKVWVKKGSYYGDTTNPEGAFYITENNRIYGGFKGDEAPDYDLSQRDFNKNQSILDGQGERRVLMQENALNAGTAAIWDGFIIRNGAKGTGAGAYLNNYVTLSNCTFKHNHASMFGGGIYINSTGGNSRVYLNNCCIRDNSASMGGGICDRIGASFTNCFINNNIASTKGGGIYLYNNTEPVYKNCIINNNTAKNAGGIYARGKFTAYNCDFVMNLATDSIGGNYHENKHNKYYNCIIWGNVVNGLPDQYSGPSDFEHCAICGSVDGLNNYDISIENNGREPGCFVRFKHYPQGAGADYRNDNWSLHPRSICLNAGKPNTTGLGATDIYGNPRIQKGRVEIGAYESCASLTLIEDALFESNFPYWFYSSPLTEPGYYTAVLDGQDCDSVVGLTLDILAGINEQPENAVKVWPNPTHSLLHIAAEAPYQVEIHNLLGQPIKEARNAETINLEGLKRGIYFLIVSDMNGRKTVTKVIKE
ncbi:MAG: C10 family peptidase [Bacteroidales bacterium]|nr:C10 family peptidase [Bacteroidales bacterium]